MDESFKKILIDNSLSRINELFNNDDSGTKMAKAFATVSVQATAIVLEEYEKLKSEAQPFPKNPQADL